MRSIKLDPPVQLLLLILLEFRLILLEFGLVGFEQLVEGLERFDVFLARCKVGLNALPLRCCSAVRALIVLYLYP